MEWTDTSRRINIISSCYWILESTTALLHAESWTVLSWWQMHGRAAYGHTGTKPVTLISPHEPSSHQRRVLFNNVGSRCRNACNVSIARSPASNGSKQNARQFETNTVSTTVSIEWNTDLRSGIRCMLPQMYFQFLGNQSLKQLQDDSNQKLASIWLHIGRVKISLL